MIPVHETASLTNVLSFHLSPLLPPRYPVPVAFGWILALVVSHGSQTKVWTVLAQRMGALRGVPQGCS